MHGFLTIFQQRSWIEVICRKEQVRCWEEDAEMTKAIYSSQLPFHTGRAQEILIEYSFWFFLSAALGFLLLGNRFEEEMLFSSKLVRSSLVDGKSIYV
jgi:hypothetical protein